MSEIELLRHELESTRGELLALQEALEKATSDREQYRALYMQLLERCRLLERGIVAGQKAERFQGGDEAQLSMRILEMLLKPDEAEADAKDDDEESLEEALTEALQGEGDDDEPKPAEKGAPRRPRRGRRKLPQSLPRVEIEVLPPEVLQEGLENFRRIGEVVSETVERRPGSLVVARIVRPKFARKDDPAAETIDAQLADETPESPAVVIAPPPEKPIERGLAGPGLLAHTIVLRWGDHNPANRQEAIHAREGLPLSRQTICSWHQQLADLVAAGRRDDGRHLPVALRLRRRDRRARAGARTVSARALLGAGRAGAARAVSILAQARHAGRRSPARGLQGLPRL